MTKKMNKRGITLNEFPGIALTVVLVIVLLGAGILAINSFKTSDCTYGANTLRTACLNSTGGTGNAAEGLLFNASTDGADLLVNTSSQFPVIGTIVGVSLLVGVVLAGFLFARSRA